MPFVKFWWILVILVVFGIYGQRDQARALLFVSIVIAVAFRDRIWASVSDWIDRRRQFTHLRALWLNTGAPIEVLRHLLATGSQPADLERVVKQFSDLRQFYQDFSGLVDGKSGSIFVDQQIRAGLLPDEIPGFEYLIPGARADGVIIFLDPDALNASHHRAEARIAQYRRWCGWNEI